MRLRGTSPDHPVERLADGHRIARLTACRYEQPHTQFNGGFIVRWPHCGRLDVYAGGERIEAAIPFGRSCERR